MRISAMAAGLALVIMTAAAADAQQVPDSAFAPAIARPAFARGAGPVVLVDEGHVNFHTTDGRYYVFAQLLRRDGYVVRGLGEPFTRESLAGARVLVIANALHARNGGGDWILPTPSAFTPDEIAAVEAWVREGGSLLLIADHMPFPGAADGLSAAFGVAMGNGFAYDSTENESRFRFTRGSGLLADHPITNGRDASERVDSIDSFTGQAFRLMRADAQPLMTLAPGTVLLMPEVAWQFSPLTPRMRAGGLLQGAVMRHGRGRVAVFGEAALFSAQLAGPQRAPMGMNDPGAPQNAQFLLNVLHWLTGVLE
ncbi:DUF4350 domain-containing protein [Longimicrobium sp.]|uniref:DUF4350 domain-containing protein n=1 Tax=Longimicrobium sp. TaxID=2029185 RepID=UPI002E3013DA|nr:DUF4350 domain-containing protein [Longimicrobium sp.]HEX6041852.1 DUF4350 domain-containing protein [Longimicrobium sp.]